MKTAVTVPKEDIRRQFEFMEWIAAQNRIRTVPPKAFSHAFGCQQNVSDLERINGMLVKMGYTMTDDVQEADVVIYNTCAVREHAESRALGNIGALSHLKKEKPDTVIALCGCMVQQESVAEKVKRSYPQVDLVFGTHALWRFPELLYHTLTDDKRIFDLSGDSDGQIAEGLPVLRGKGVKAWLPIMNGCNNFCTYCIVPYVRGRERSREPEAIEQELRDLIAAGYKDITLLGQNVNSYGKTLENPIDFADLLRKLNDVPGEFLLRFMTSHPKDATQKLFDTMVECEKVAKQLHLPFQSGSDAILKRMNRGYTIENYRELIAYARNKMPGMTLSSDIIVGFPGETEGDFQYTLELVQEIEFDVLYAFLYSKRKGTPAAEYADCSDPAEKQERFQRLLAAQDAVSERRQNAYMGKKLRVLVDGNAKGLEYPFTARTEGNILVCVRGADLKIGQFTDIQIEKTTLRCLFGCKI